MITRVVEVSNLHLRHPRIRACDWRSPLICRLLDGMDYREEPRTIKDSFRDRSLRVLTGRVDLRWSGLQDDFERYVRTYQAPVVTEHAALGLACILTAERGGLEITDVTRRGDKADYWIGDRELLLEVSGQQEGNLRTLRDAKRDQLLENPFGRPGFVCVVDFGEGQAFLWYYALKGGRPG